MPNPYPRTVQTASYRLPLPARVLRHSTGLIVNELVVNFNGLK